MSRTTKTKRLFSFRLDESLMESVKKVAEAQGSSVTGLVEIALKNLIENKKLSSEKNQEDYQDKFNRFQHSDASLFRELLELVLNREQSRQDTQESQMRLMAEHISKLDEKLNNVLSIEDSCDGSTDEKVSNHT